MFVARLLHYSLNRLGCRCTVWLSKRVVWHTGPRSRAAVAGARSWVCLLFGTIRLKKEAAPRVQFMKILKLLLTTSVSLVAIPLEAFCQRPATVGELLEKGGKKLTKEEVTRLVTGATVSGMSMTNYPNFRTEYTYKSDSSMNGGSSRVAGSEFISVKGGWSVTEDGQLRTDRTSSWGNTKAYYDHYFYLRGKYYASRAADKGALVVGRAVKHVYTSSVGRSVAREARSFPWMRRRSSRAA